MRTVRLYEPGDAAPLATLHAAAFGPGGAQFGLAYWRGPRATPPNLCVVAEAEAEAEAEAGGGIVAYCDGFLAGGGGDVNVIGTAPDHRGQGHGAAVLTGFLTEAARRGAAVIHLEVAETNAAARALYARLGFEAVGRRRRYYADGADALVLAVSLDAPAARP